MNFSYDEILPDYGDLDNQTGSCPGHRVAISEKDGGINIELEPLGQKTNTIYGAFMNIEEAREFSTALQESIKRAAYKNKDRIVHPRRAKC